MFLILTLAAAIVSTIVWYVNLPNGKYKLGLLSLIYWGATIMWAVDHVIAYIQEGGPVFEIDTGATMLGILVVLAGLVIWLIALLSSSSKKLFSKA